MNDYQVLNEVIKSYQEAVWEGVALMQKHGFPMPTYDSEWMDYAQENKLGQKGYADDAHSIGYFLHGIGCTLYLPAGGIDWNFGHDGRIDGFDMWRLWTFAHARQSQFPDLPSREQFERMFAEAHQEGRILQPFRQQTDFLFYKREGHLLSF